MVCLYKNTISSGVAKEIIKTYNFYLFLRLDPIDEIIALAQRLKQDDNLRVISLGEEQQLAAASNTLRTACQRGSWVVIKNCHLTPHWPSEVVEMFHVSAVLPYLGMREKRNEKTLRCSMMQEKTLTA